MGWVNQTDYFIERNDCPVCHSNDLQQIYACSYQEQPIKGYLDSFFAKRGHYEDAYLTNVDYVLMKCKQCRAVYQRYIPNGDLSLKLYEEWIDPQRAMNSYHFGHSCDYYADIAGDIALMIRSFNQRPSDLAVLDFGMGWGAWARMATAFGCNVYGLDISQDRIEFASKFGIKVLGYDNIDQYRFDIVNIDNVLEHLPEPDATVELMGKIVKPNGLVRVRVPNGGFADWIVRLINKVDLQKYTFLLGTVAPLEHINAFTIRSFDQLFGSRGFKRVHKWSLFYKRISLRGLLLSQVRFVFNLSARPFGLEVYYRKHQ